MTVKKDHYVVSHPYGTPKTGNLRKMLEAFNGVSVLGGCEDVGYKIQADEKALEAVKAQLGNQVDIDVLEPMKCGPDYF